MTDFLDEKRREITERLKELKPLVDEFNRLEDAARRSPASADRAPRRRRAQPHRRRRGPGRPRGSANRTTKATTTATKAKADAANRAAAGETPRRAAQRQRHARRRGALVRAGPAGITIPELAAKMGIKQNYLYRVLPGPRAGKKGAASKAAAGTRRARRRPLVGPRPLEPRADVTDSHTARGGTALPPLRLDRVAALPALLRRERG